MQARYKPVEITTVDPVVAQMQARAEAYLRQDPTGGWFNAPLSQREDKASLSKEIESWMKGNETGQTRPVARPGTPIQASLEDRELLARTLMAEAGAEGYDGILAAGAVINNRLNHKSWGNTLRDVIMAPGQFSAWNSVTGYAGGQGGLNMDKIRPTQEVYQATDALLSGQYNDPTGGATHYYNPARADPAWGQRGGGNWQRIGNHVFGWGN